MDALREHAAVGRLTLEELDDRVAAALAARTHGDLNGLLADLPGQPARRPRDRKHGDVSDPRAHIAVYLSVTLMMIVIWAATGAGYFWPVWPILGWGIGVVSHGAAWRSASRRRRGYR